MSLLFARVARGRFPPSDGITEAMSPAARRLIPPGEYLFLQVAPDNATSLRAVLAAGCTPHGSELRFEAG